jgi:tRNA(Ile)-lysidine synthetase-like protein
MSAAGPPDQARAWSADHLRLHRHLRRQPSLLPTGVPLLLSVSGGQDSMAMTGLLADLRRLHGWSLTLWHGDHGWRPESGRQAGELAAWAASEGLPLVLERAQPAPPCEDQARQWRYRRLAELAALRGISHVVTGHTATDRAETVLLNLARGSHRRRERRRDAHARRARAAHDDALVGEARRGAPGAAWSALTPEQAAAAEEEEEGEAAASGGAARAAECPLAALLEAALPVR